MQTITTTIEDVTYTSIPAFTGDIKRGHLVTIVRPAALGGDLIGIVDTVERINEIPRPYLKIVVEITDGQLFTYTCRPDAHAFIHFPVLADNDVALTIGLPGEWGHGRTDNELNDDEGLVCRGCVVKTDVPCATFTQMELEPGECCKRCNKQLSPNTNEPLPITPETHVALNDTVVGELLAVGPVGVEVSWETRSDDTVYSYTWQEAYDAGIVFMNRPKA